MLISTILVAALLFCVALVIVAEACRPMLRLRLNETPPLTHENENDGAEGLRASDQAVRTLSEEDRDGFCQVWGSIREEFDNDPTSSVVHADLLMSDLIDDCRGRVRRTDPELSLLSFGRLASRYRNAHAIAVRGKKGSAERRELERAMGLYTVLFDELLGMDEDPHVFGEGAESVALSERQQQWPINR